MEEYNPIHKVECEEFLKAINSTFDVNRQDEEKMNTLLKMEDGAIPVMIIIEKTGKCVDFPLFQTGINLTIFSCSSPFQES